MKYEQHIPEVLHNKEFAALLFAGLISRLGDSLYEIGIVWLVVEETGDPALISLVVIASLVPETLAGIPAGALVDRLNRKTVMLFSDILRGIVVLSIPLIGQRMFLIPLLFVVAIFVGILDSFFTPAKSAIVPRLIENDNLDSANGLLETANSISRMFYAIGGIAVGVVGSFSVFYLNSFSFFLSAVLVLRISNSSGEPDHSDTEDDLSLIASSRQIVSDSKEGISFIYKHPVLPSILILYILYGVTIGPFGIVLPIYADSVLNRGSIAYGILYAGIYLGIFISGIILSKFESYITSRRGKIAIAAITISGWMLIGLSLLPQRSPMPFLVSVIFLVLFGMFAVGIWAPTRALIQTSVADEKLGRVFSVVRVVASGSLPIGVAVAGPLLETIGPTTLLLAEGCLLVVSGILISRTALFHASE